MESAKETIFEVIGRTLDEQLKVECLYGYALCGGNPELVKRSQEFLEKKDRGRASRKCAEILAGTVVVMSGNARAMRGVLDSTADRRSIPFM